MMSEPMKVHCQVLNKTAEHLPCLVLLHGWGFHRGAWPEPWLLALQQRFQVILVDLPGHGEATTNNTSAVALLEKFIEALSAQLPDAFHLLGWSLGGQVALKIASHDPGRVQSLVCLASNPHFTETDKHHGMAADALQHFTQSYLDSPAKTLTRFCRLQSQGARQATCRKQLQAQIKVSTGQIIGLYWLALLDGRQDLANSHCQCLYVFAEADALVPVAVMQDIKVLIASSNAASNNATKLQSLPGCHGLPFEYPDPSPNNPLWTLLTNHWDTSDYQQHKHQQAIQQYKEGHQEDHQEGYQEGRYG